MSARVRRVVDYPLLLGPTKKLICSANANVISSEGPILVTCRVSNWQADLHWIASPPASQPVEGLIARGSANTLQPSTLHATPTAKNYRALPVVLEAGKGPLIPSILCVIFKGHLHRQPPHGAIRATDISVQDTE